AVEQLSALGLVETAPELLGVDEHGPIPALGSSALDAFAHLLLHDGALEQLARHRLSVDVAVVLQLAAILGVLLRGQDRIVYLVHAQKTAAEGVSLHAAVCALALQLEPQRWRRLEQIAHQCTSRGRGFLASLLGHSVISVVMSHLVT